MSFGTIPPARELRVRRHRVSPRTTWLIVELIGTDGFVGLGEFSGPVDFEAAVAVISCAAAVVPRSEPIPVEELDRRLWELAAPWLRESDQLTVQCAIGAVLTASCDLAARHGGLPLWRWLGGEIAGRSEIPTYANVNRFTGERTPDRFAERAERAVSQGATAIKLAPFDGDSLPGLSPLKSGVRRVAAVRERVGSTIDLMVDVHNRLDRTQLSDCINELEDLDVVWLEDAIDVRDEGNVEWLASLSRIPITGGEFVFELEELKNLLGRASLAHTLIDPKYVGGPLRVLRVAGTSLATAVSFHNPSGPVGTALCVQLAQLLPSFSVLEYATGEDNQRRRLVDGDAMIPDGSFIALPNGDGLGMSLRPANAEDIVAQHVLWTAPKELASQRINEGAQ